MRFFLVFVFFIASPSVLAQTVTLRVCEESNWPPYTYEDVGRPGVGIAYDLMTALTKKLGWQLDMQLEVFSRCLKLIQQGQRDAISIISENTERNKYMLFSDTLVGADAVFYYNRWLDIPEWDKPEDLSNYKIVAMKDYNLGEIFNKASADGTLNIKRIRNINRGFELLERERIDLFMLQQTTGRDILKRYPLRAAEIREEDKPYFRQEFKLGFSRSSPLLSQMKKINQAIRELHAEGVVADIVERYAPAPFGD